MDENINEQVVDNIDETKNDNSRKLKTKLIISLILLLLAIAMLITGIWASQAGNDLFKGFVDVSTEGLDGRITAKVNGSRTTTGEGYESAKILWDSQTSLDNKNSAEWNDIDFTFADKNAVIELVIHVENRNIGAGVNSLFIAKLGDVDLEVTEKEIGDSNIIAYIEAPLFIDSAIDPITPALATYKVVLKIADKNKSIKATKLEVSLNLTDATIA